MRTTFIAVPSRRSVVAAKACTVTTVMLALGVVVTGTSFGVTQAILARHGGGYSLTDEGVLPTVAAAALVAPSCALIGMGIGALVRNTAAAILSMCTILLILPELTAGATSRWIAVVHNAMPPAAWMELRRLPVRDTSQFAPQFPMSVEAAWSVLLLWPLIAVALALFVVPRRDL
jgi:ABC-2 type transport system permease protein